MKRIFILVLASVFTFTLTFAAMAQLPSNCRVVRGQIYCDDKATGQKSNPCLTNVKFDYLYPISPLQNMKTSVLVNETAQEKTYKITDYYGGFIGDSKVATEIYKATHTVTFRKGQEGMNTLVSKGHSLVNGFQNMNGVRFATTVPGNTRGVLKSEFDCILPITADEASMIANTLNADMDSGALNDFETVGPIFRRIR
jgi:hypothetical protein